MSDNTMTADESIKLQAEISKLIAESIKLNAETSKMNAETIKLLADTGNTFREIFWYPVAIATGLIGVVVACTTFLLKIL
ncbi:hypothetical protein [Candidatus Pantoea multigeneris]|uniref:Uncharacterized protein n=1 Tax=Candidatus Pantoea multigeneris TaxID=2608357 RepID=A0ABX0RBK9_9GAMM|nr:hypothetical protein [Pantoea multigeneris]NIF21686.1 hypothetical protein [Pantoea multigeneris]